MSHVLPLLVRAYDDNDVRIQEEVLRRTVSLAKQLDIQVTAQHPFACSSCLFVVFLPIIIMCINSVCISNFIVFS